MSKFTISRNSVLEAKRLTENVEYDLRSKCQQLAVFLDQELKGLQDMPVEKASYELLAKSEESLKKLSIQFSDIQNHCDNVIRWLDERESY